MSLIDKIKKSREQIIISEGIEFTITRPTALSLETGLEFNEIELEGEIVRVVTKTSTLRKYVVNWNAKEIDLIPGGDPTPVPFDIDTFMTWVEDKPQIVLDLYLAINKSFESSSKADVEAEKKL